MSILDPLMTLFQNKSGTVINKRNLLSIIDENLALLAGLSEFFDPNNAATHAQLKTKLFAATATATDKQLRGAYTSVLSGLQPRSKSAETNAFLSTFALTVKKAKIDLELIQAKFRDLFNGTSSNDLTVDELRVVQVYLTAYVGLVKIFAEWTYYFTLNIDLPKGVDRFKYQLVYVGENAKHVANLINIITSRLDHQNIITDVQKVKSSGGDVLLKVGEVDASDYTNDQLYAPAIRYGLMDINTWLPNVFLALGDAYISIRQYFNQRNIYLREWMRARVALLTMDLNKVDPTSDEYKRLEQVIEKYMILIAEKDKKINDYENP